MVYTCDRLLAALVVVVCWLPLLFVLFAFPKIFPVVFLSVLPLRRDRLKTQLVAARMWTQWGFVNSLRTAHSYTADLSAWWEFFCFPRSIRQRWAMTEAPPDVLFMWVFFAIGVYMTSILQVGFNVVIAFVDAMLCLFCVFPDDALVALGWRPSPWQVFKFGLREGVPACQPWASLYFTAGCPGAFDKLAKEEIMRRNKLAVAQTFICSTPSEMETLKLQPNISLIAKPNLGAAGAEIVGFKATPMGKVPTEVLASFAPRAEYIVQRQVVGHLDSRSHSLRAITVKKGEAASIVISMELLVDVSGSFYSNTAWCRNRLLYARGCRVPPPSPSDDIVSEGLREAVRTGDLLRSAEQAAKVHDQDVVLAKCLVLAWDFVVTEDGPFFFEFNCPCYLNEFVRRMQAPQLLPLWEFWLEVESDMRARIRGSSPADIDDLGRTLAPLSTATFGRINIVFLVHGVMGSPHDWDTWVSILQDKFPTWLILPLSNLQWGARFLGEGIDDLAEKATTQIAKYIQGIWEIRGSKTPITLHFIGHSMGGLVARGCLPAIMDRFPSGIEFGHFVTLATPHLGGQAAPGASYLDAWKNLSIFTTPFSSQAAQLSIQDIQSSVCGSCGCRTLRKWSGFEQHTPRQVLCRNCFKPLPYMGDPLLVEMADPSWVYIYALTKFKTLTCVALIAKDGAVHPSAGLIRQSTPAPPDVSENQDDFWGFGPREGTTITGSFESGLLAAEERRAQGPRDLGVLRQREMLPAPDFVVCEHKGCRHLQERKLTGIGRMRCDLCKSRWGTWRKATLEELRAFEALAEQGLQQNLTWERSSDGALYFPTAVLRGLDSLRWQRIPVFYHARCNNWLLDTLRETWSHDVFYNGHIFLLGKASEQDHAVHRMSRQCIECLAALLEE